jgi:hypothetical protein
MRRILRIKTETLERFTYLVAIVGFPLLILSTLAAFYQIREMRHIVASQNNIALNAMVFDNERNSAITDAIENGNKILKENGGKFFDSQLDSYLGDYETVFQAYNEGYLTEEQLCVSFSYYVTAIFKNPEIQEYIRRKDNAEFFGGASELNRAIKHSKNVNCH